MILTRCPNCCTTFRVTPEQLRFRHGQVRCGSCFATFNALAELTEEPLASAGPTTGAGAASPGAAVERDTGEIPTVHESPLAHEERGVPFREESAGPAVDAFEVDWPPAPSAMEAIGPTAEIAEIGPLPEPLAEMQTEATPVTVPESGTTPEPVPEPLLHEGGTRRQRSWPWLLAALLAATALLAQAALHFRTELALRLPETRPALEAACEQLGCEIALPSRIDLLEIEHSDLVPNEKKSGHLQLSATLRNRAAHAQTWPHLELTLTDTNDRALLRRALTPKDYLPTGRAIAAGFPARGDQLVQLDLQAADVPAVGYRLYLFYP